MEMERHFMRVETQTLTEDIDTRALDYILHVDESGLKRDGNEWLVSRSKLVDIQKGAKKVFRRMQNRKSVTVRMQRRARVGQDWSDSNEVLVQVDSRISQTTSTKIFDDSDRDSVILILGQ